MDLLNLCWFSLSLLSLQCDCKSIAVKVDIYHNITEKSFSEVIEYVNWLATDSFP